METVPLSVKAAPSAPPRPLVATIESKWSGATVQPGAVAAAGCSQTSSPFLTGDFDGDGVTDVAVPVKRPDGVHLVAGLLHTYEYGLVDVTGTGDAANASLTLRRRGTLYRVPGSIADHYFGEDTIVLTSCAKTPTAYLWNGASFDPQPLME